MSYDDWKTATPPEYDEVVEPESGEPDSAGYGAAEHWPLFLMWCVLGATVAERGMEPVLLCEQCGRAWCFRECPRVQATLWAGHPDLVRR